MLLDRSVGCCLLDVCCCLLLGLSVRCLFPLLGDCCVWVVVGGSCLLFVIVLL